MDIKFYIGDLCIHYECKIKKINSSQNLTNNMWKVICRRIILNIVFSANVICETLHWYELLSYDYVYGKHVVSKCKTQSCRRKCKIGELEDTSAK